MPQFLKAGPALIYAYVEQERISHFRIVRGARPARRSMACCVNHRASIRREDVEMQGSLLRERGQVVEPLARNSEPLQFATDTTFEIHYTVSELAKQWHLGRETVRLLLKDEPGVLKIRMGARKSSTRYSIPESVARRIHTRLFNPGH